MFHLVTLTTDFGDGSCYVAAMKGVLLGVCPAANIIDLSHRIPPQDLRYAAYFLLAAVPYFPPGTLHVVVVDPGVGSERGILYVEAAGQRLLAPDNGCWTLLVDEANPPARVIRLTEPQYWRPQVSNTFHGRDIFAPVAGHLLNGADPAALGEPVAEWRTLALPRPTITDTELSGEVVFIDDFGNLLTNIPGEALLKWADRPVRITAGAHVISRRVRTYAEADSGALVGLISSMNTVEIAVVQGSAARILGAKIGWPVQVRADFLR
jgi:S-adenosylmethionine hydrolase